MRNIYAMILALAAVATMQAQIQETHYMFIATTAVSMIICSRMWIVSIFLL